MHFRGYAENLSCSLALRVQLYYHPFSMEDKTGAERSGYMHVVIKQTPYEVLVNRKYISGYFTKYQGLISH